MSKRQDQRNRAFVMDAYLAAAAAFRDAEAPRIEAEAKKLQRDIDAAMKRASEVSVAKLKLPNVKIEKQGVIDVTGQTDRFSYYRGKDKTIPAKFSIRIRFKGGDARIQASIPTKERQKLNRRVKALRKRVLNWRELPKRRASTSEQRRDLIRSALINDPKFAATIAKSVDKRIEAELRKRLRARKLDVATSD